MKRELRYGANVEWFLNDIAAVEMSDIDSGEFEIYGEDEAGRETCTYIDITELAADAAQLISELRDQLQAAEHLAELRGRQNLDAQKKVDALAAENAARGEIIERLIGQYSAAGYHAVQNSLNPEQSLLFDAMQVMKQPAADAWLNSVRAEAILEALHSCTALCDADCVMDAHDISREDAELRSSGAAELGQELVAYANQLRAGKDGE